MQHKKTWLRMRGNKKWDALLVSLEYLEAVFLPPSWQNGISNKTAKAVMMELRLYAERQVCLFSARNYNAASHKKTPASPKVEP
jgi:hypothetical protein